MSVEQEAGQPDSTSCSTCSLDSGPAVDSGKPADTGSGAHDARDDAPDAGRDAPDEGEAGEPDVREAAADSETTDGAGETGPACPGARCPVGAPCDAGPQCASNSCTSGLCRCVTHTDCPLGLACLEEPDAGMAAYLCGAICLDAGYSPCNGGCCDSHSHCQMGDANNACAAAGQSCVDCTMIAPPQTCQENGASGTYQCHM
jgi:hypothetical protein